MPNLLTDSSGIPLPQGLNTVTNQYEPLQSTFGSLHVLLYDANGNPIMTAANPGYAKITDNSGNVLSMNTSGAANVVLDNAVVLGPGTSSIGTVGLNAGSAVIGGVTISGTPPAGYGTALAGSITVGTAGSSVSLGNQTIGSGLTIIANPGNTGKVYVFPTAGAKADVIPLKPGDSVSWPVNNLSALKVDADNNGSSIYWQGAV